MTKPSFGSQAFYLLFRLLAIRKKFSLEWLLKTGRKPGNACPPDKFYKKYAVTHEEINQRKVWYIRPKENATGHYLLYLHGGAYVQNFLTLHWALFPKLIDRLGCTIVAPDYPLAPEHQVKSVYDMLIPLYQQLVKKAGAENLAIMGDSAGGGISLALAQQLREEKIPQPASLVLLSPWLDISLSTPGTEQMQHMDPILSVEGLRECGKLYAGNMEKDHYLLSPVNGTLNKLAPLTLFIGGRDVLLPDCRRLKKRTEAEGISMDYHEYPYMLHDWMLLPIPEAREVLDLITLKLKKDKFEMTQLRKQE
ncbi:MAG: alpha/beta hydrolase [Cyclobacteriaceae bacterium]